MTMLSLIIRRKTSEVPPPCPRCVRRASFSFFVQAASNGQCRGHFDDARRARIRDDVDILQRLLDHVLIIALGFVLDPLLPQRVVLGEAKALDVRQQAGPRRLDDNIVLHNVVGSDFPRTRTQRRTRPPQLSRSATAKQTNQRTPTLRRGQTDQKQAREHS